MFKILKGTGYDPASRLRTITQAPLSPVDIRYDALGRRTRLSLPNGISTAYAYDPASRLIQLTYTGAVGLLGDLSYQYDFAGNRVGVGGSLARTLLPDAVPSASYDAANQQLAFGSKTLTFDANGNLTSIAEPTSTTTFTWDARNQLAALGGATTASFAYDAQGRRVVKQLGGQPTQLLYDGADVVQQFEPAGSTSYLRSLNIDEALSFTNRDGTYFSIYDPLGSTVAITDLTATFVARYTYDPFGTTSSTDPTFPDPFQFTGRENDRTGLYAYRDRYYHPGLARFISEDRLRLTGGINFYAYALNNPITFLDPLGLQTWPGRGPVNSGFGPRQGRPHRGADVANPLGGDVRASDSGTVGSTTPTTGGGNTVVINHDDGGQSTYMHTDPTVRLGDRVYEGQSIGRTDLSGNSRGPHVHYEYRPPGSRDPVNPLTHLPRQNNYSNPPPPPPGNPGGPPSCMGCGRGK